MYSKVAVSYVFNPIPPAPFRYPVFLGVGSGESGWFRVGSGGFGWVRVVSGGFDSVRVVSGGFGWFRVGSGGFGWVRVIPPFSKYDEERQKNNANKSNVHENESMENNNVTLINDIIPVNFQLNETK